METTSDQFKEFINPIHMGPIWSQNHRGRFVAGYPLLLSFINQLVINLLLTSRSRPWEELLNLLNPSSTILKQHQSWYKCEGELTKVVE